MLLPIQDAWLTFSNSRIFPIPINILIRLRGWLNGFLSFFPRLFQFFPSLTAWLGFATVESNRFLAPSEAITLGDIDYMNTPKKIERTFAKTKSNPEGGSKVRFVSALQKTVILDDPTAIDVSKSQSKSAIALINSNRRILDPNLVSFRNMALVITAST